MFNVVHHQIVTNGSGELSTNYPCCLVILEDMKAKSDDNDLNQANGIKEPEIYSSSDDEKTEPVHESGITTENGEKDGNGTAEANSDGMADSIYSMYPEHAKIKELFNKARYARCRTRFPVPVILYNKKHICR